MWIALWFVLFALWIVAQIGYWTGPDKASALWSVLLSTAYVLVAIRICKDKKKKASEKPIG